MGASDVFVLQSICEGLGFVFIEAHAMDLPIVTTDIPHTKIVVHEDNSLQFTPRDQVGLAEQLELALDEAKQQELVAQGKKALDRLSTGRQHDRVEAAFREIAEKRG
jgi:glycosyltransferase involved in cell wall biosynthesis